MSGSLLGRGRGGRLAVYAGCVVVVILLVFAYRAAVSEMARLRELHEECTIHQESLQQRLQVIFDYKVRLEKSLADETSANAAVKQELQQRATREKSRRDKDSIEAMQRYNSLQQAHKILETEKEDLQEECDKRQKQALDDTTRLEATLQGLRAELKQAKDDKAQSIEHLKSRYLDIDNEKTKIQEKYNDLVKTNENVNLQNQQLKKEVAQLTRELDNARKLCSGASIAIPSMSSPSSDLGKSGMRNNHQLEGAGVEESQGGQAASQNSINLARPPAEQQSTSTTMLRIQATRGSEVFPKASTKSSTQSGEKIVSEKAKVKLPFGVLPIPKLFDPEKSPVATESKNLNGGGAAADEPEIIPEKDKLQSGVRREKNIPDLHRQPPIGRRVGDQPLGHQENWMWQHKVPPGVQEVGEDPNNLEKIPELEDTGNHPIGDGVDYGPYGGDYEKLPKNNDIHIEEGEDEGEDEDDPVEYEGNNLKVDKHPE